MHPLKAGLFVLFLCTFIAFTFSEPEGHSNNGIPLTAKTYSKFLRVRRRDHMLLIQNMLKADYTKNYKMISVALDKIFHVMRRSNQTLGENRYTPAEGFPIDILTQEAVTLLIENCCLAGDIIFHFPDISYRILKTIPNWRDTMNWCIDFVNSFHTVTDELIVELMDMVRQEINRHARNQNFINSYTERAVPSDGEAKKPKKPKKKIKKGPQLTQRTEL